MTQVYEGSFVGAQGKFAIVVSRWNDFITSKLLEGAIHALTRYGIDESSIEVAWVPGAWEAPLIVQTLGKSGRFDAIICLGAILKGATPHADHLAGDVSGALARLSLDLEMPITWGVLVCDTIEQAIERAGTKMGNKGAEAAISALEMTALLKQIKATTKE